MTGDYQQHTRASPPGFSSPSWCCWRAADGQRGWGDPTAWEHARYMQAHLAGQAPSCQSTLTAWPQPWGVWGAPHSGHGGLSVSSPLSEGLQRQEPAHPPECATQMEMAEGIMRGSSHPGVDVETLQRHQDRCSALSGVPQHIHSTSHQARA